MALRPQWSTYPKFQRSRGGDKGGGDPGLKINRAAVLQEACIGVFLPTVTPWVRGLFLFGEELFVLITGKQYFLKEGVLSFDYVQSIFSAIAGPYACGLAGHSPDSPLWTNGGGVRGRRWWAGVSQGTRVGRFEVLQLAPGEGPLATAPPSEGKD